MTRAAVALPVLAILLGACAPSIPVGYPERVATLRAQVESYHGNTAVWPALTQGIQALIDEAPRLPHGQVLAAEAVLFTGVHFDGTPDKGGDAAAAFLDKAASADPKYCPAFWVRGQLQVTLNKADEALQAIKDAEALGCIDPWQDVVKGRAAVLKRDAEPAMKAFHAVIDAGPGTDSHRHSAYAAAMLDLGQLLLETDQADALRALLAQWDQHADLFDAWGLNNEAGLWTLVGDFEAGVRIASSALAVQEFTAAHGVRATALAGLAMQMEAEGAAPAAVAVLWEKAQAEKVDMMRVLPMLQDAPCCRAPAYVAVLQRRLAEAAPAKKP